MEKKENISLETSRHIENLKGMQAVLQVLMANVDLRLSYIEFNEAFALFLSYNTTATTAMLSNRGQRKMFIDLICHPNYGIPVYVVKKQYLLLKSNDVDLDLFFEDFFSDERNQADNGISPEEINDVIDSLDTAWDKKAVKVLLAAGHSNRRNVELGIGSRVSRYRRQVLTTIEAKKELRLKAKDFLFFNNHQRLKEYINASQKERKSIPGSHYFKKVQTFMDTHFEIGEKYLEYVRHSCSISGEAPCDLCAESNWEGGKCARIPKPMPDYSVDGLHYMSVLHTPIEMDGKARTVDDFQPRENAKDLMEQGKLTMEDEFEHLSKTFVCEKELVRNMCNTYRFWISTKGKEQM